MTIYFRLSKETNSATESKGRALKSALLFDVVPTPSTAKRSHCAMNLFSTVFFITLLGTVMSQNRPNSKGISRNSSPNRRTPNPSGSSAQPVTNGDPPHANLTALEDNNNLVSHVRTLAQTLYQCSKSATPDEMKLNFLKSTAVTCNDGTPAGYYIRESKGSKRWLIFLEGGWCCYNKESCDARYRSIPRLMGSSEWPQTQKGSGILSSQPEENPHWWNANTVFVPYCSSDVWSGTAPKTRQVDYAFMGSLILKEVIRELVPKGIKLAKVVLLAGTSAGGTGVLLNIERVAHLLAQLGADVQVRGLVDSGWFLDNKQPRQAECPDVTSCSPNYVIKKGLRLWNGVIPERCRQQFRRGDEWQCFFGYRMYSSLKSPVFVVQWLFDEEQLKMENIQLGSHSLTENQWNYIQNLGRDLRNSLRDVSAVFAPACLSHTMISKSNWLDFQVRGTSLNRALQCWDRSLQENKSSRPPVRNCSFHLIDQCRLPHCNPTCPALRDQVTGQEVNMIQLLMNMGFDVQRIAQQLGMEPSRLLGMLSNGG
ncbi:carboxylesterase notum2 [Carcharodon carcharias]|uniref:carboxylesterase notum2 n=1 Tax=Carcharodon carcharias TaxID=13397 RepID=UPI001B7E58BE|nr:carboxylesterase notum2 [Carcharodon carcharias]